MRRLLIQIAPPQTMELLKNIEPVLERNSFLEIYFKKFDKHNTPAWSLALKMAGGLGFNEKGRYYGFLSRSALHIEYENPCFGEGWMRPDTLGPTSPKSIIRMNG